jgi:hypothetical protein
VAPTPAAREEQPHGREANQERRGPGRCQASKRLDPVGPYVNADGSNSTAQGKLYMKFIAGGTGTFGIFLMIKTDGG